MNVNHTPPGCMKDKFLRFRVTQKEHDKIMEQAYNKGYTSFSDYIRTLIQQDMEHSKVTDLLTRTVDEAISQEYNK